MNKRILSALLALAFSLPACSTPAPRPVATEADALPATMETTATEIVTLPLIVGSSTGESPAEAAATESVTLPLVIGQGSEVVLETAMGMLQVVSSRLADEANGTRPEPGQKILLVILDRPGEERLTPENFSLEAFDQARSDSTSGQQVHLVVDRGEQVITTMAGWVAPAYEEFAMGFFVPETARSFVLNWPGNPPIEITPTP